MVVGGQGAQDWLVGVVVVPDCGGEGEDALQDADGHSAGSAAAVPFEVELTFEGFVDRLDDLPQRLEQLRSGPLGLTFADRPDTQIGQPCPIADQRLARALCGELGLAVEQVQQGLAFVGLGSRQREGDGQAVQCADQCSRSPQK